MRVRQIVGALVCMGSAFAQLRAQNPSPEAFRTRDVALNVAVDFPKKRLSGSMTMEMENWTKQPASRVSFILNRLMEVSSVTDAAGNPLRFTQDVVRFRDDPMRQVTQILVDLRKPVPPSGRAVVRLNYGGNLVGYTEIGWLYVKDRIDTTFTILREDALAFPRIDGIVDSANRRRPTVPFTYRASVSVPSKYIVAAGGTGSRAANADGTTTWTYVSVAPSPFLNISIAPFDTISQGGLHVFYFATDSVGARRLANRADKALTFLTQWFGPLHSPPTLTITEIPDGWGSQASLIGGIIQTAAAFRDSTRTGELYHELSHLWNADDLDNPSPRWNEGLAMFEQDLLRERVEGWPTRAESEKDDIKRIVKRLGSDSSLQQVPMIQYGVAGNTGNSYRVGSLMFATLFDLVGEQEFNRIVGGYYQQFGKGGTTRDFIAFAGKNSSRDLSQFFDDWLLTTNWVGLVRNAGSVDELVSHYKRQAAN